MTMTRYAHGAAAQQRDAADLIDQALTGPIQTVTQSITGPENGVARSGHSTRGSGSGGRIRTYDLAVNRRPP